MALTVNIIGAGRLGKTIGRLIVKHHSAKIGAIYNQTLASSKEAIQFIGAGDYFSDIKDIPPADVTILATPDDIIGDISVALYRCGNINPGNIFIHCSGVLTSEIMSAVKLKDGLIASVHPMKSFANPNLSVANYEQTYCAMEGDKEALAIVEPLFKSFGSITYQIDGSKKALYHAAGVFASNYLITLAQQALACLQEAGVEGELALSLTIQLMKGTLLNVESSRTLRESLTGPLQRGDSSTIKKHLNAVTHPTMRALYALLGKATLELTANHPELKEILEQ